MLDSKARNIVVAVSGSGRSLANFLRRQQDHWYHVCGVISSREDCGATELARSHRLPIFIDGFTKKPEGLEDWLKLLDPTLICLAGFLKPFPLDHVFGDRVVNIHPSLLPAYGGKGMYGMRVHKAVIEGGEDVSGATIHRVTEHYDEGPIIAQTKVEAIGHTAEELALKVFEAECELYPLVVDKLLKQELPLEKGEVYFI